MKLSRLCRAAFDPRAWARQARRVFMGNIRSLLWRRLDAAFSRHLRLPSSSDGVAVLADGLWNNPNHFFRLRLFIEGVPAEKRHQLAALLRTPHDRSRKSLEALGFTRFFCLSDTPVSQDDHEAAIHSLVGVQNHRDLLSIELPCGLPADVFYDTALKLAKHPKPPLDSSIWEECLADVFRLHRFYTKVFDSLDVGLLVLSHPWKNEFGVALWEGLSRKIPCFHLNAMYESIRIKRFNTYRDFFMPVEFLDRGDFDAIPQVVQSAFAEAGLAYLEERATAGSNTDINQVMAYRNDGSGYELREHCNIQTTRPVVLICCHVWYDFPHCFGMRNFTDFQDWTEAVLAAAIAKDDVTWLIKRHPTESWYGGFSVCELVGELPDHVCLLPDNVSISAALDIASAVVTVHGTVAVEATVRGIPVLCADKSPYSNWEFVTTAVSRTDFLDCLNTVENLPVPDKLQIIRAAAFAYLVVGPGKPEIGLLRLPADHVSPLQMFSKLLALTNAGSDVLRSQGLLISSWLKSGTKSFSIFHKMSEFNQEINMARNKRSGS